MDPAEVQTVNTTHRLGALRELMAQEKYDVNAVIIPSEDQRALRTNRPRAQPADPPAPQTSVNTSPAVTNVGHLSRGSMGPLVLPFDRAPTNLLN